jgi:hypothetical protein
MTDNQSAILSWRQALIWSPWPDFCFLSDDCGFLDVGHPLWRKDGSVIYLYNCFWASTLGGLSPWSQSQSYITTVSWPVRPGVRRPSGTHDQFPPFSLWLFFRQFRVCWKGAPSLTRSRVCTFQFLHHQSSLSQTWVSRDSWALVYCSYFWDSANLGGQDLYLLSWVYLMADGQSTSSYWYRGFPKGPCYIASAQTIKKTPLPTVPLLLNVCSLTQTHVYHTVV